MAPTARMPGLLATAADARAGVTALVSARTLDARLAGLSAMRRTLAELLGRRGGAPFGDRGLERRLSCAAAYGESGRRIEATGELARPGGDLHSGYTTFMSTTPAATSAAATTRKAPTRSRRSTAPRNAAKMTLVSRSADTAAIAPWARAQITMP
jgi:hypothetical protein